MNTAALRRVARYLTSIQHTLINVIFERPVFSSMNGAQCARIFKFDENFSFFI